MKKLILTVVFASAVMFGFGQTKPVATPVTASTTTTVAKTSKPVAKKKTHKAKKAVTPTVAKADSTKK